MDGTQGIIGKAPVNIKIKTYYLKALALLI
jgi:hypothetical protein